MTSLLLISLTILLCGVSTVTSNIPHGFRSASLNLVPNGDFEDTPGMNFYECRKAECEVVTEGCHSGQQCIRVSNRTHRYAGPTPKIYNVAHLGGQAVYVSVNLKTPMDPVDQMFYEMRIMVGYKEANKRSLIHTAVARQNNVRGRENWWSLGGDITLPNVLLEYITIFVDLETKSDAHLEFLVDVMSVVVIPHKPDWREEANVNIERYRKNNVRLTGQLPANVLSCLTEIKIKQKKHHFGFGCATPADRYSESTDFGMAFRQFHRTNFNWLNFAHSMTWQNMEKEEGFPNYGPVDKALLYAQRDNQTVRANSLTWNDMRRSPRWLEKRTGEHMETTLQTRIQGLVGRYKDKIHQWGAVNEWLHGDFFETSTGNPDIQHKVYQWAREVDPDIDLCINDYQGLGFGDYTSSFVEQINRLDATDALVNCLGVQSRLEVRVPPEILSWRLNVLATANKPIVITQISVHQKDETVRAQQLDEALHIYFSHPNVTGLLFWLATNYKRLSYEPKETLLFHEFDKPTAAGQVYLDLHKKWHTNTNFLATSSNIDKTIPMFHGAYDVEMLYKGESVSNQSFYLHPGGDMDVNLYWQEGAFVVSPNDSCPKTIIMAPTTTTTKQPASPVPTSTTNSRTTTEPTTGTSSTSTTTTTAPSSTTTTTESPTTIKNSATSEKPKTTSATAPLTSPIRTTPYTTSETSSTTSQAPTTTRITRGPTTTIRTTNPFTSTTASMTTTPNSTITTTTATSPTMETTTSMTATNTSTTATFSTVVITLTEKITTTITTTTVRTPLTLLKGKETGNWFDILKDKLAQTE